MTLPELLAKLPKPGRIDVILAALYHQSHAEEGAALSSDEIRHTLKQARVPKASEFNITDYLSKAGAFVDSPGVQNGKRLWRLTPTGISHVLDMIGKQPSSKGEDISVLTKQIDALKDLDVKEYLSEALTCVEAGARRAAVVFAWVGAVRLIQSAVIKIGIPQANAAIQKHYSKAREVKAIDDLQFIQESTLLLSARDLGIFDKGETQILEHCLNVRNKCGHPGKYKPGEKSYRA